MSKPQIDEPALPDDVSASDLDPEIRRDLQALDRTTADRVARHLVMASDLLGVDPDAALAHARAARARGARVGVVRETAGIAAYNAGEWQEAITELRAARRMTGADELLPLIADSERGLGRPERAVEIAESADGRSLTGDEALEMLIVASGACLDLGEPERSVALLETGDLRPGRVGSDAARLFYAYASSLEAAGRRADALTWFQNAAAADVEDLTDAEFRLMELTGDDQPSPGGAGADSAGEESSVLGAQYDTLLFDLDGTLFAGSSALPHAVAAVNDATAGVLFVTNNASRSPSQVAEHLTSLGFEARPEQVVTSAQAGAALVAERVPANSGVLVVGAQSLRDEITARGLLVVDSADDEPAAVVQGHSPDTGWAELSEAALAVRNGALWVACNVDTTLPNERGLLVGNGSMVAAVKSATGAEPLVAGKPAAPIMRDALSRGEGRRPLVVGDRLDTDIAGAHTVGLDSLLVLTGVSSAADLLAAAPDSRPTYVAASGLAGLASDADSQRIGQHDDWRVTVIDEHVTVASRGDGDPNSLLPTLAHAVWTADVWSRDLRIAAEDDTAAEALSAVGLDVLR
ncbi:HAD-IIA family hydrolase [Gordonia sp. PDNC005]|uniref:HAD-IIA family hydrolase n=1 Tax=unclassified Gordonia (in: high G+C Gram-positive bacteria) TaxID=2657482 RepID=UPI001963370F|nr:HAD-IIA family hydrolase [Gordonia sp. PDNC005]QRY64378.1 HAD-IIA family hydrolase [Gordonia sp. PDNC005]